MLIIGLLMFRGDEDILEEVLDNNLRQVDYVYVLDGTDDNTKTKEILKNYNNIKFYTTDNELPDEYQKPPRDGARQILLEQIKKDHGDEGWIVILHSDEIIYDFNLRDEIKKIEDNGYDHVIIRNVHFFLHITQKNSYTYKQNESVINQVTWASFPGHPEFRIFKNLKGLEYTKNIMGNVLPDINTFSKRFDSELPFRHYLYRTEEQMKKSAQDRSSRAFQGYGSWVFDKGTGFVDCLPGYQYAKQIKTNEKI